MYQSEALQRRDEQRPPPARTAIYLVLRVGGYEFATPAEIVRQLMPKPEIFPLPQSPLWCLGMLSLPDVAIPVLNLRHILAFEGEYVDPTAVVVEPGVSEEFPQFAFLVDRLTMTTPIRAHEIIPIRASSSLAFRHLVSAAWRGRSRPCYLLRLEAVIPLGELHLLPSILRGCL